MGVKINSSMARPAWKQKNKRLAGQDNHALPSAQGVLKDSRSISRCPAIVKEKKEIHESIYNPFLENKTQEDKAAILFFLL